MPIAEKDIKQLWGGAGGYCSNPICRGRVAITSKVGESYLTGEMAHIVARQAHGPRGDGIGGDNSYENLVLLCPTCHTRIDKAPADYPADMLLSWKTQHEAWVDGWQITNKMSETRELMDFIFKLLTENDHYFRSYGPHSATAINNPLSSAYAIWVARKLDIILPNNRKIIHALDNNKELIPIEMAESVHLFRDHSAGFEQNQYGRLEDYQLFPPSFAEAVEKWMCHE